MHMKNIKFIQVAASLGIIVPTCLLGIAEKCHASEAENSSRSLAVTSEKENPIKDKILNSFNAEEQTPPTELVHSNVHANYTVPHTDIHSNYKVDGDHTNQHSNTRAKHTNQHSNYK